MTTKNLVPRADGEGKIGVKGSSNLTWKEINAVSGSFDELVNTAGNNLITAGNNITVTKTSSAGSQYTISSQASAITGTLEDLSQLSEVDAADKFIVSTGLGSFGYENPAAVRSTLGLSSSDSVTFDSIQTNTLSINNSPTNSSHAATKSYVDSVASGLDIYDSVRAATTSSFTMSSTASSTTLALVNGEGGFNSSTNAYEVDGINLDTGDRVLIKNGVNSNNSGVSNKWNGIYTVGDKTGSTLTLTRSADMDVPAEFNSGAFFFVEEGTNNADAGFVLSTDSAVTVGTTDIEFVQFSGAGQILAGNALTKSGNTLNVDINGQTSETSVQDADEILIYDNSASAIRKMTRANFVSGLGAGSLSNIVEDTTPQLGAPLDVNGHRITSASNGLIEITPDGTGAVKLGGNTNPAELRFFDEGGNNYIALKAPADSAISADATFTLPATDGNADQVLKTDGSGNLDWVDQASGTTSKIKRVNSNYSVSISDIQNNVRILYTGTAAVWYVTLPDPTTLLTTNSVIGSQSAADADHIKVLVARDRTGDVNFQNTPAGVGMLDDGSSIMSGNRTTRGGEWITSIAFKTSGTPSFNWLIEDINDKFKWKYEQRTSGAYLASDTYYECNGTFTMNARDNRFNDGELTLIKNVGTGTITIDGYANATVDGQASITLSSGEWVELMGNPSANPPNFIIFNRSLNSASIDDLGDINITSPTDNSVLTYDSATSKWIDSQSLDLTGTIEGTTITSSSSQFRLNDANKRLVHYSFPANFGNGLSGLQSTTIESDQLISVKTNAGAFSIIPLENDNSNTYNGTLRIYDGGDGANSGLNRHYIALATPGKLSSSTTYSLPSDDGSSGDVLSTDGAGALSWSTPSGGGGGGGSATLTENTLSADLTIPTPTASRIVYVLTSSADRIVNLPAASGVTSGTIIDIKSVSNVTFTITPNGSDDLDTVSGDTFVLSVQYSSITLICNGSDGWFII